MRLNADRGLTSALFGDQAIHHVLDLLATLVQLGHVDLQIALLVLVCLPHHHPFPVFRHRIPNIRSGSTGPGMHPGPYLLHDARDLAVPERHLAPHLVESGDILLALLLPDGLHEGALVRS